MSSPEVIMDQKFSAILATVKRAKTDNEKFAALLIVAKLTKAEDLPDDKRRLLLRTIGIKFPTRLLSTACIRSTEKNKELVAYANIGASVLSLFCSDDELVKEDSIGELIPHLMKCIVIFSRSQEIACREIINDCLYALEGMLRNEKCVENLSKSGVIEILCRVGSTYKDHASRIISSFLVKKPGCLSDGKSAEWLHTLTKDLKTDQGTAKFTACDGILRIFCGVQSPMSYVVKPFIENVICGLEQILCGKLTTEQRKPALLLASEVLRLSGIADFAIYSKNKNFVVILARLACIEIGLFFRDAQKGDSEFAENQLQLLMPCFTIAECFCSAIAQFEQNENGGVDILTFEQIRLTQPALADMINSVTEYVSQWLPQWRDISKSELLVLKSSVRMLGCWLNVENNATSAQGIETLPLVPKVISFVTETRDWELIKAILPVIMISGDSSEAMKVLISCGILEKLGIALLGLLECDRDSNTLHLLLQSILSLYSSPNFTDSPSHCLTIKDTFLTIAKLSDELLPVVTRGYVYPLAAVILKHLPEVETDFANTFQNIVKFVFDAYSILPDTRILEVEGSYKEVWPEISPLWQVCIQNLVECLESSQLLKNTFLNSQYFAMLPSYFEAAKVSEDGEIIELFFNLAEAAK